MSPAGMIPRVLVRPSSWIYLLLNLGAGGEGFADRYPEQDPPWQPFVGLVFGTKSDVFASTYPDDNGFPMCCVCTWSGWRCNPQERTEGSNTERLIPLLYHCSLANCRRCMCLGWTMKITVRVAEANLYKACPIHMWAISWSIPGTLP